MVNSKINKMAQLSDVNYSLTGELQKQAANRGGKNLSGVVYYGDSKKKSINPNEWYIFKLVDNSKKGGVYIPSIDDVVHPETGKIERMRLLRGVDSIWLKDQKDITKDYVDRNLVEISFPRGVKIRRVKGIDRNMVEFLRLTNANIGNPKRIAGSRFEIFEYDAAAADREAVERESFELEQVVIAQQEKVEPMKKHAAFLGIRMIDDVTGFEKTPDGIRKEYLVYAKRNPEYFKRTRGTEQVEVDYMVRKAIAENLIDIGREQGRVFWAQGGGMIGVYPQTQNAQDYLTGLALTNTEEGRNFKEQLKKVIT